MMDNNKHNLWDLHTHSHFSGDSTASLCDMILSAKSKGLGGICFTDHLDLDYPNEPDLFLLDLPHYYADVTACQKKYANSFPVCFGIELGLQPHLATRHKKILSEYSFDFVIGSSHTVHGIDPYYPAFFERRAVHSSHLPDAALRKELKKHTNSNATPVPHDTLNCESEKAAYLEYFESILENIACFDDFDVYGHLDYVVRYAPNKEKNYHWHDYEDIIDEILRHLISLGKGIEVNTGGLRYGLTHPNPTEDILRRYKSLGGEIVTIGSDAHKACDIAFAFEKIPHILKNAGFSYFTVYKNRKPNFLKLP